MKRPTSITVLCLLLGWLAFAGLGNAAVLFSGSIEVLPKYFAIIALIYGLCAACASIGLWRMKPFGLYSLRAWFAACLIFMLAFSIEFKHAILGGPLGAVGFLLFFSGLFYVLHRYAQHQLQPVT